MKVEENPFKVGGKSSIEKRDFELSVATGDIIPPVRDHEKTSAGIQKNQP